MRRPAHKGFWLALMPAGEALAELVVIVNARPDAQEFSHSALRKQWLFLHPILKNSHDPIVRRSRYEPATGTFFVPARTTAVFVSPCR